jgi:hypothetical protein
VNEQETRQEYFLRNSKKLLKNALCHKGRKSFKNSCCRKAAKALQFQPADFAAATDRAAVNQEAGDFPSRSSLLVFLAAKEFVALNGGNHTDGAFFARLGALHAAEATDSYRSGQSNFVGQGQKNLNRRAFPDILGKKEVDTAGTDIP